MPLVFQDVAKQVLRRLGPDGDSFVSLPAAGAYFSTDFGSELIDCLKQFSRETYLCFNPKRSFTIPALSGGYRIVNWSRSEHNTLIFFEPTRVWVEGQEIRQARNADELLSLWIGPVPQAVPSAWAILDEERIVFDVHTPNAGVADCFVAGFHEHPNITADTGTGGQVLMARSDLPLFRDYAQWWFRKDAWKDAIGAERLRLLERDLFSRMAQMRALRMERLYSGVRK
jgi:hypothetical protein